MRAGLLILTLTIATSTAFAHVITLTRSHTQDFGDPSPPTFPQDNTVTITTTGGFVLTWSTTDEFFSGANPKTETLNLCHDDGTPLIGDEDIWDPTLSQNELIGSVMVPPPNEKHAKWPDDAASRRTFAFHQKNGCWTRDHEPLWWTPPGWMGHTYGHGELEGSMFYEQVTKLCGGGPCQTDLFIRRGRSTQTVFRAHGWPSARRRDGGELVEGARPFKIGADYFISFSAGDFDSDNYGIHLLKAKHLAGPYQPILTADQKDLKNFDDLIENEIPLTWGAGRAVFFEHDHAWWMIAHGIPSEGTEGHRQLFMVPIDPSQLK